MKRIPALLVLMLLAQTFVAGPSKAIVVTVDGLKFDKVLQEIMNDYRDAREGIKADLTEQCTVEPYTADSPYLETAINSLGLGFDIEVAPYRWQGDPQCSLPEVENLRAFIIDKYEEAYQTHKKFILVAHSWGTVLAYAALHNVCLKGPGIDLFITLGSPLGAVNINSVVEAKHMYQLSLDYASRLINPNPVENAKSLVNAGKLIIDEAFILCVYAYLSSKFKELNISQSTCDLSVRRWINYWNWGDGFSGPIKRRCPRVEDRTVGLTGTVLLEQGPPALSNYIRGWRTTIFWHGFNSLQDYNSIFNHAIPNQELKMEVADLIRTTYEGNVVKTEREESVMLGLILDSSGSMKENDKGDARKIASEIIVNRLSGDENVFIVDFDHTATWLNSGAWASWTTADLIDCIRKVDSDGNTDVMGGLRAMRDAIQSSAAAAMSKGVLLLTDGLDNQGIDNDLIAWYRENHIPLYTVSLAGEENAVLLKDIAAGTCGQYEKARTAEDIVDIFNRFFARLSGNTVIASTAVSMKTGDVFRKNFFVDNSLSDLSLIMNYAGSEARVSLRTPRGTRLMQNDPGAEWTVGRNYVIAKISNPENGRWTAEVKAISMPSEGEPVSIALHGKSAVNWALESEAVPGNGISFVIRPHHGPADVKIGIVSASMIEPDGTVKDVTPIYKDHHIGPIPVFKKGSYTINVSFTGTTNGSDSVQRQLTATCVIGDPQIMNQWSVTAANGMFISSNLTKLFGARVGVYCNIYSNNPQGALIAKGIISFVNNERCDIELREIYAHSPRTGDIIVFDSQSFSADRQ